MIKTPFRSAFLRELAAIAEGLEAIMTLATFKWAGTWTDRSASTGGTVSTELNSLANNGFSAVSGIYDNTANLDEWGCIQFDLASLAAATGAYLQIFIVQALDGTNYEDAPSSTNPGSAALVGSAPLTVSTSVKRANTRPFRLPPGKFKWVVKNGSGVALAASGNTAKLFTSNEQAL